MTNPNMRPCFVYRLSDASGAVIYVGRTVDPAERFREHKRSKAWWPDVAAISAVRYNGVRQAEVEEAAAIKRWQPKHNSAHTDERGIKAVTLNRVAARQAAHDAGQRCWLSRCRICRAKFQPLAEETGR